MRKVFNEKLVRSKLVLSICNRDSSNFIVMLVKVLDVIFARHFVCQIMQALMKRSVCCRIPGNLASLFCRY